MSNQLETTYRRTLRWYPKRWRAANEEAVVGTLMESAEADERIRPAGGELADLRGSALALRLGPLGRVPSAVRDRASALAFGFGSGVSAAALIALVVQKSSLEPYFLNLLPAVGPFVGYSFLFYGVWIVALVAALSGWKWAARLLATATVCVAVALRVFAAAVPFSAPTTTTIVLLAAMALITFLGNPFATARGRIRIAVSTAGWAAFLGSTLWFQESTHGGVAGRTDWYIGPLWQWLYWIVPFALMLALVLVHLRSGWGGAVIVLLVPIVPFVVFGWSPRSDDVIDRGSLLAIAIAIVLAIGAALRFFRIRITVTRV